MRHLFTRATNFLRMTSSRVQQPAWHRPRTTDSPVLRVRNSLAKDSLQEFIPVQGRRVTWYCCGPTVYDAGHMGHARNYVTTDVIRRLLRDYFGYDVVFVQNVTDIDDKIIVRARQLHLFQKFALETNELTDELRQRTKDAWVLYGRTNLPEAPKDLESFDRWANSLDLAAELENNPKFVLHLKILQRAAHALLTKPPLPSFLEEIKDMYIPFLDTQYGSSVTDPSVFRDLAAYWERHFDTDMSALNVLAPTITTRVSEYVPQIVRFVEEIENRGLAYENEGSVYFDTTAFEKRGHHYAKLEPGSKANTSLISEGEGSLTASSGKRSVSDFALWKASKVGEPAWNSPWGKGRPGWHIECSVMASEVLGSNIDIHSGGIDLAFPHHDNELAQSEAYHGCDQWINYFWHTGHLHIEGQKMSKSLKNFISIREAIDMYSARQLRLAFLMQNWDKQMDFKRSFMDEVKQTEKTYSKFFDAIKGLIAEERERLSSGESIPRYFGSAEKEFFEKLEKSRSDLHLALCDNFDTPKGIQVLTRLVANAWEYITCTKAPSIPLLHEASAWMTHILGIFGIPVGEIGWKEAAEAGLGDRETIAQPFARALSKFRDNIRGMAIQKQSHAEILRECDRVRDVDCLELGVMLDDRAEGPALVKFVNRDELIRQRDEKEAKEREKAQKKKAARREAEAKRKEKLEKGKLDPMQMFKTEEFSAWDEKGIPTVDANGGEIAKARRKRLQKDYDQQVKLHEEYLESEMDGANGNVA